MAVELYVRDLEDNVTEEELYDHFNQIGPVVDLSLCRNATTRRSLGCGYVTFCSPSYAERAIEFLNFSRLNGKPIRIMYLHRDPCIRKRRAGTVFIKNLDKSIESKHLHETFATFGTILSSKLATDPSGQSKGYGFVQYKAEDSAKQAIKRVHGMLINDKQVYVGPFLCRQERANKIKFTSVYVKNLSESMTDENLANSFGKFGKITSAVVRRNMDGKSKCFGFVNFENADEAAIAVVGLNGQIFDDKEWYVDKAQKKAERKAELKQRFEQRIKQAVNRYRGTNLIVRNFDVIIDEDKLKELFSQYGTISSCKVMHDPCGVSKGSGFLAFSTPEEASRALREMKGKMIAKKPLYVAVAQHKEDWKATLQMLRRGRYRYLGHDATSSPIAAVGILATLLANAVPEEQRLLLGENLYPLVEQLRGEMAAKVTGMLLEMDQIEVLYLLEYPDALKSKVAEAIKVLRTVAEPAP